jgi:hypothetical protein
MKYNLIEIRPNRLDDKEKWMVRYDPTDKHDRKSCKTYEPTGLGFFYYPRKWGPQKAFDILKKDMIDRRAREIQMLKEDVDYIEKMELPDWVK